MTVGMWCMYLLAVISKVRCTHTVVCRRRTSSRKSRLKPRARKSTKQHKPASADISTQETTTPGSAYAWIEIATSACQYLPNKSIPTSSFTVHQDILFYCKLNSLFYLWGACVCTCTCVHYMYVSIAYCSSIDHTFCLFYS